MSIKKFGIVAGLVFALSIVLSPAASACSLQDLSSCDNDGLMALIVQMLAGQTTTTTTTTTETAPTVTGLPAGFQFNTNLKLGSTGNDVKYLQILLNADSATAVGNAGSETTYFGSMTQAAVVKFQNKYASEVLTPYGLSAGTGFFGTSSRAKANALLGSLPTTPGTTLPAGCTSTSGFSTTTGQRCDSGVSVTLPAGCTSTAGFSPITGERCDSGAVAPGTPTTGAGMTVSVASGSPAGTTLVEKQAIAPLAKYTLVNSDSVEAKITKVELQRTGVSADTTLKNVYLYDGDTRLTDAATISQGKVTFNNPNGVIVIPAGTSKVITVVSDIDAGTSGQTVGVSLTGLTANVDIKSTMPVTGGTQTIATATLATVAVGGVTPATSTINAGTANYTIFSTPLTIGTRAVNLKGISVKMIGSIPTDALENIQLYVNGIAAGNATVIDSNNMVRFNLATPVVLQSGSSTVEIRANVVKGSSRNFTFSLENASDLVVVDSVYNVNVLATGIPASTGTISIAAGSVSVTTDATFNATTVTSGVSNATLAKYNFKAFGEDVKISYLRVNSSRTFDNMTVYVNGAAVTSSQNVIGGTPVNFSLGSSLIVPANTTVSVEVRGDTKASGVNIADGQTIAITLNPYTSSNAQGVTSSTMSIVPSSNVSAQTLTVGSGSVSLNLSLDFASGVIAPNTANQKIGSYVIQAGDAESVRVSNVSVALGATNINNLSNLYIKYGATQSTPIAPQPTNNFPVNIEVAANQSLVVDVYADVGNQGNTGSTITATASGSVLAGGVDVVTAVKQVNTVTLSGASQPSYGVTINGITYSVAYTGGDATLELTTDALVAAINADATNNTVAAAKTSATTFTVTADAAGTGFTITNFGAIPSASTSVAVTTPNTPGVLNVYATGTINVSGIPVVGDIVSAVVAGATFTTTAITGSTATSMASTLAGLINAGTHGASASDGVITITSATAGTAGNVITLSTTVTKTGGSAQSTLGMNATGISSNSTITVAPVAGQIMTIASPTLNTPVLATTSSPVAQYVLGGSESIVGSYHFTATNGSVNITEAKFSVTGTGTNTITHITVDGKTVQVSGTTATVTGINFNIPQGFSGRSLPVTVKYNTVGSAGGTTANRTSIATLTDVKYVAGNTTTSMTGLTTPVNTMTVVGGIPTVNLVASTRTGLSVGTTLLGEITVNALTTGGPIRVKALPIKVGLSGATLDGNFSVKIGTTDIATTGTAAGAGEKVITLSKPYTIAPNQPVKFEIYANVNAAGGANDSVTTELGARGSFDWIDVEGNILTGLAGTLVSNYSTNVTSVVKK